MQVIYIGRLGEAVRNSGHQKTILNAQILKMSAFYRLIAEKKRPQRIYQLFYKYSVIFRAKRSIGLVELLFGICRIPGSRLGMYDVRFGGKKT